jgi:hypothetical protein
VLVAQVLFMPPHHRLATIWHRYLEVEASLAARAQAESAYSAHLDEGDDDVRGNDHSDRNGRPGFSSIRKQAGAPPSATTAAARQNVALSKRSSESSGGQPAWPKFDWSNITVFKAAPSADMGKLQRRRAKMNSAAAAAAAASRSPPLFRAVAAPLINSTDLFDLFTAWDADGDGCACPLVVLFPAYPASGCVLSS